MSKEEILFKISGVKKIHHTTYNATEVEMAMNEHSRQQSIEYGKWLVNNTYRINPLVDSDITHEGLYTLFLQSQNK